LGGFVVREKSKERITAEWERRIDNLGVISVWPSTIISNYLKDKDIPQIINMFWNPNTVKVNSLDVCVLFMSWWNEPKIKAARSSWFKHPTHHSSEYIFDTIGERLILQLRQPDLDGKHWRAEHIHILKGKIDVRDNCCIIQRHFKNHVEFIRPRINGHYIVKIK